ncbi:MAG: NnrU family protein [Halioglobus sp.]
MLLLLLGISLFASVHFIPSLAPALKSAWQRSLGDNGYKGLFSLLLLAALAMIILGWRSASPVYLYSPPPALQPLALGILLIAILLLVVSNRASRVRNLVRHPQLTGVALWGAAHLMLNGDSRSLVLFAGLSLWAAGEIFAINRREGVWIKTDTPGWGSEVVTVAIAVLLVVIVIAAHPWLAGVPVF